MNIFIIVLLIIGVFLFVFGLLEAFTTRNGTVLISASILIGSCLICYKIEEIKLKQK